MTVVISGQHLPNQHVWVALTYIYGIGRNKQKKICKETNINPDVNIEALDEKQQDALRSYISTLTTGGEARTIVATNIKKKKDIGSYQGRRHRAGLPVRGQRTKTNAKTAKRKKSRN